MSTDSTELTFVRCPSCRSLVPAVSTRCRMCGAAIDAQAKEVNEPEPPSPRRARTSTVVQPPTEFVNATEAVRAAESAKSAVVTDAPKESGYDDFDPLKDYLDSPTASDEVPEQTAPTRLEPAPVQTKQMEEPTAPVEQTRMSQDVDDEFDIFGGDDDDDDWLSDIADPKPAVAAKNERKTEDAVPTPVIEKKPEMPAKPAVPSSTLVNGGRSESKSATRETPRVVVESGHRQGKPSGLSFGKGRNSEDAPHKRPQHEARPEPRREKPVVHEHPARHQAADRQQPERRHEPRAHHEPRRDTQTPKPIQPQQQRAPQRDERHREKPRIQPQEGVESRLAGWFVSFSTAMRSSLELREGKFFVSGASLKPNDVVLDDSSISTPHAMITVESGRLLVQDLMSETGVYRRREGEQDFSQINETFELTHGDWIRFGQVEFLVILIPAQQ